MHPHEASSVPTIGRCIGCNEPAALDVGVCRDCLAARDRGPRWAELARRCRLEPEFARQAYAKIDSEVGRAAFIRSFGLATLGTPTLVSLVVAEEASDSRPARGRRHEFAEEPIRPPRPDVSYEYPRHSIAELARLTAFYALVSQAGLLAERGVHRFVNAAVTAEQAEAAARLVARWSHDHGHPDVGLLGARIRRLLLAHPVDTAALACALAVAPHPDLWSAWSRRSSEPTFLSYASVREALGARRERFVDSLRNAVRHALAPDQWRAAVEGLPNTPCACELEET